jgi:hypothetical protein
MEYKEIFKLMEMLTQEGIPFEFIDLHGVMLEGWQICYPSRDTDLVCSIVEHKYSYGNYADRLEIMGLLTEEERASGDSVMGWLTAEDVFQRIKEHWEAKAA